MSAHPRKRFFTPPKRVALFVTCMVDMLYPAVGMATVDLLEQAGIEVIFPPDQTCCGQPAFNSGFRKESREVAIHFLDVFEPLVRMGQVDAIVAPSGSCVTMVSHFYPSLFDPSKDAGNLQRAHTVSEVTFELTEFLVDVLGITDMGAAGSGTLTYHACCHGLRELGIEQQPRQLLANVAGVEQVELRESTECCGFGGLFAVKNAPISEAMGRRKMQNIADSGADVVALCDVSCMTHINGLLSRQKEKARAIHIAQILTGETVSLPAPSPAAGVAKPATTQPAATPPPTPAPAGGLKSDPPPAKPEEKTPIPVKQNEPPPRRWQDPR